MKLRCRLELACISASTPLTQQLPLSSLPFAKSSAPFLPLLENGGRNVGRWKLQRGVVYARSEREPNFIDIGVASRGGWDEVRVVRTSQPLEPKKRKPSKPTPPPRTPLSRIDVAPEQQKPIVEATKRGRGGKTVTVIKGLQLQQGSLDALCKNLKVKIGTGGAVKEGKIEIQGDHSAKLVEELVKLGYQAKKSGR